MKKTIVVALVFGAVVFGSLLATGVEKGFDKTSVSGTTVVQAMSNVELIDLFNFEDDEGNKNQSFDKLCSAEFVVRQADADIHLIILPPFGDALPWVASANASLLVGPGGTVTFDDNSLGVYVHSSSNNVRALNGDPTYSMVVDWAFVGVVD